MPKLHQRQDGEFYILHNVSGAGEGGYVTRHFGISDDAADLLKQEGYREGSSLPHDLFHELLQADLIWSGQIPPFVPSDVGSQVDLTAAVAGFFTSLETGDLGPEQAIDIFRVDVLSKASRLRDAVLKKEMFLHIAQKLTSVRTTHGDVLEGSLQEMKSMLSRRTPPQWEQIVRVIFGPYFTPSPIEIPVSADDSSERSQDRREAQRDS